MSSAQSKAYELVDLLTESPQPGKAQGYSHVDWTSRSAAGKKYPFLRRALSDVAADTSKPTRLLELEASTLGWRQRQICAVVDGEFYASKDTRWQ